MDKVKKIYNDYLKQRAEMFKTIQVLTEEINYRQQMREQFYGGVKYVNNELDKIRDKLDLYSYSKYSRPEKFSIYVKNPETTELELFSIIDSSKEYEKSGIFDEESHIRMIAGQINQAYKKNVTDENDSMNIVCDSNIFNMLYAFGFIIDEKLFGECDTTIEPTFKDMVTISFN